MKNKFMNNQKGFAPIIIALIVAVILGGGYLVVKQQAQNSPKVEDKSVSTTGLTKDAGKSTFCHNFSEDIKEGSRGYNSSDVFALNQVLVKEKLMAEAEEPISYTVFSKETKDAVIKFQTKYTVKQTGIVDSGTRLQLNKLYGCGIVETKDWKTYTNTQLGFSLSYPADFANVKDLTTMPGTYMGVCLVGNNARIQPKQTGFCYIGNQTSDGFATASLNITLSTSTSMQDCQKSDPSESGGELISTQQTTVNGITFYKAKLGDAAAGHYVSTDSYRAYHGGTCYTIGLYIESDRGTLEKGLNADFSSMMLSKLESILATLKFTTPKVSDETADWKIYADENMGVSVKYPSSWTYQKFSCNLDGVAFCPLAGNSLLNCKQTCGMNSPESPIYLYAGKTTAKTDLKLNSTDYEYKKIYDQMLSTLKFKK